MSDLAPNSGMQPSIGEELAAIPYEPLLPVEKKLIVVSLLLGVTLLGVLSWATKAYFPIDTSAKARSHSTGVRTPAAPTSR